MQRPICKRLVVTVSTCGAMNFIVHMSLLYLIVYNFKLLNNLNRREDGLDPFKHICIERKRFNSVMEVKKIIDLNPYLNNLGSKISNLRVLKRMMMNKDWGSIIQIMENSTNTFLKITSHTSLKDWKN